MSITYIFKCDQCGCEEEHETAGFMSQKEQSTFLYIRGIDHESGENHLCQDCYDVQWEEGNNEH